VGDINVLLEMECWRVDLASLLLDYISLQYQYSLLLELGESFQSFSQFLDLEKSCLGACTHNLLIT